MNTTNLVHQFQLHLLYHHLLQFRDSQGNLL
jgi:hypothetical protein